MNLQDKNILLGVTGGIAAYKTLELTRLLRKAGANVWPVMTKSAGEFITPLSLSTLAGNPANSSLFNDRGSISHIDLADRADLIVIAPATANIIGKAASGIADDLLSTLVMAANSPVLIAPAMNDRMYDNPIVAKNIEKLATLGYLFVGPGVGELACGYEGRGRLAPVDEIFEAIEDALSPKDLEGEKILITAGATRENIDPVRYLTNGSSGAMGYAIAREAKRRGAHVVLISGSSTTKPPYGITHLRVESAEDMSRAVERSYADSTCIIMAAAVSDYRPSETSPEKIKKADGPPSIELLPTTDILKGLGEKKEKRLLVGFALETSDLIENAKRKLEEKKLDLVIANEPTAIANEKNRVAIISPHGEVEETEELDKREIAKKIVDRVAELVKKNTKYKITPLLT